MKSQDIGLLLKLVSLQKQEEQETQGYNEWGNAAWPQDWADWEHPERIEENVARAAMLRQATNRSGGRQNLLTARYTSRALEQETGISKSQINLALNRCYEVGLAKVDRHLDVPRVNILALFNFIIHGLKYVFPAKQRGLARGIATTFAAPVLKGKLMSAGEFVLVWPDARGKTKGQAIEPLFISAPLAVRRDPEMYALLALVDAIRIGQPREANLASEMLKQRLGL